MRTLSKSKLLSYRQCPKRLWLELHRPELLVDSSATQARFATGHRVGEVARHIYDPQGHGTVFDLDIDGYDQIIEQTKLQLQQSRPIFEAGFCTDNVRAYADVMLASGRGSERRWRMVEVKSSTSVKDYHRDDAAIQAYIARRAGVPLNAIAVAHVDNQWTYPGGGDYQGLLAENDLTDEAFSRSAEVSEWIRGAHQTARRRLEPAIGTGAQCSSPYDCGFIDYCSSQEPKAEYPVQWLPGTKSKAFKAHVEEQSVIEMADVPDELLNDTQRRVKDVTLSGVPYFNRVGAAESLRAHTLPAYFLDFETISHAVPIWEGTRPYQTIPFQFSVHRLSRALKAEYTGFLDLSGKDPSRNLATALLNACGERGPVFAYNASFEKGCIRELANRFVRLAPALNALHDRIVDLLPVARAHFYHPDQAGSWSIKAVLPAACPDLRYDLLDGVQDGQMAMSAYQEAIAPETDVERKRQIQEELERYCALDTYAMVRLWAFFSGRSLEEAASSSGNPAAPRTKTKRSI